MTDTSDDMPDMTAAEFALGVLDGEQRRAAAARLASDQAFAAEVAEWEERLAPLSATIAPVMPSPQVWTRISTAIGGAPGVWSSLPFWRGATLAGIAVATASLVLVATPLIRESAPPSPPTAPALLPIQVAALSTKPGEPASVVAILDPNSRELVLTSVQLKLTPQQSPELWVIPRGQDPISLGVMDMNVPYRIPIPGDLDGAGRTTATLAITAEQLGGSPDKKPHGPIIAAGTFSA